MPPLFSPRSLVIIVLPALVTWAALTRGDIAMSPDSLFYWSAAHTIYFERSIATGVSPLDYARTVGDPGTRPDPGVPGRDGSIIYPLTVWPPGYPLAIAALLPLAGGSVIGAARVLSVITLVLLVCALTAAAAELVGPERGGYAAAIVACLPVLQNTVRVMWSDALFAVLVLAALTAAARALNPGARAGRALVLAATAAALATYVRYTGILVLFAFLAVFAFMAARAPGRRVLFAKGLLALAVYGLLVAPLYARNYSLAGELTGGQRSPAGGSVARLLGQLVLAFVRGLVPWVGNALPGPRDAIVTGGVSVAAWTIAGVTAFGVMRRAGAVAPRPQRGLPPLAGLLGVFAALYCAVLLAVRVVWQFDFNTRMLLPAVASVALLAVCAFQRRIADAPLWRVNRTAIVMTALATIATLKAADRYQPWRGFNDPDLLNRPGVEWARRARAAAGAGTSLRFVSAGYVIPYLHFAAGGAPVAGLPNVPEPTALLGGAAGIVTVVVLEPTGRRFRCPEYASAYRRVLDMAADSVVRGEDFTAWWLSPKSAVEPLRQGTEHFAPSCP